MMTPQHTPGPWRAFANGGDDTDPRKLIICAKGGFDDDWHMIAQADYGFPNDGDPEANARLIAAAPEMLEVLRAIQDVSWPCKDPGLTLHDIRNAVAAIIKKAEAQS
ncbi:MAG: hypothetical protein ABW003_12965 [Microvirga sp.]